MKIYLYPLTAPGCIPIYIAKPIIITNSKGIINLLAFSIPSATPNAMIAKLTIKAITIHILLPKAEAVAPKVPPIVSISVPMPYTLPVNAIIRYLNIQPTTHEYPIARANDPRVGIIPIPSPSFLLFPACAIAAPKAPIGPLPVLLPRAISSTTPVLPINTTNIKYGIRKVIPPNADTKTGNLHRFPIPTAEPTHAIIKPTCELKPSCFTDVLSEPIKFLRLAKMQVLILDGSPI